MLVALQKTRCGAGFFALVFLLGVVTAACAPKFHTKARRTGWSQKGTACWYGKEFHGRQTASGEIFNMHKLTAAHPSLPFGTVIRVTNLDNKKSTVVRINDRGPAIKGRIIDLSYAAAEELGMLQSGLAKVKIVVKKTP